MAQRFVIPTMVLALAMFPEASSLKKGARNAASPTVRKWEDAASDKWWLGPSRRPKLIFFAGMEGSGHQFMQTMWRLSFPNGEERIAPLPKEWQCGETWTSDGITTMEASLKRLGANEVWSLPHSASFPECGMQNHTQRVLYAHPRLDYIAQATRNAGVELHVIFLHRSLEDLLEKDCIYQEYESCDPQSETLWSNAKYLTSQLGHLKPDVVSCFNYTNPKMIEKQVRNTFGSSSMADELVGTLFDDHIPSQLHKSQGQWKKATKKLQTPNHDLDSICSVLPQINLKDLQSLLDTAKKTLHRKGADGYSSPVYLNTSVMEVALISNKSTRASHKPISNGDFPILAPKK